MIRATKMNSRSWKLLLVFACVCLTCCIQSASAYLFTTHDQRLDRALIHARVVYGHIEHVRQEKAPQLMMDSPGDLLIGTFQVEKILLDDRSNNGDSISNQFDKSSPKEYNVICHPSLQDWPEILVPFVQGKVCILVFGPAGELRTIVPAGKPLPNISTPGSHSEETRKLLVRVLSNELRTETSADRQVKLILELSPIMTPAEATAILPRFLESKDEWLRRAAIAGMAFATREPKYVQRAASDLHSFLTDKSAIARVQKKGKSAYHQLFQYYFFLEADWSTEETARLKPFLPLFRIALSDLKDGEEATGVGASGTQSFSYSDDGEARYRHGLDPLHRIGTSDDLLTLYRYHDDHRVKFRQAALEGISRIMNIGLHNYVSGGTDFLSNEKEEQQKVRDALVRAKLVPAN